MNNTDACKHQTISELFPAINLILLFSANLGHGNKVSRTQLLVKITLGKQLSHLFHQNHMASN